MVSDDARVLSSTLAVVDKASGTINASDSDAPFGEVLEATNGGGGAGLAVHKRKFIPDFLVRYKSGKTLVLEVKGEDSAQDQAKRVALRQWVEAVNAHGGFGAWVSDVVIAEPSLARDVIDRNA